MVSKEVLWALDENKKTHYDIVAKNITSYAFTLDNMEFQ